MPRGVTLSTSSERQRPRPRGAARVRLAASVSGRLDRLPRAEARQRRAADPVLAARLGARARAGAAPSGCHRPGVYHGDTRRGMVARLVLPLPGPARARSAFRCGCAGPEQVFRFVLRRPVANAGAVILSQGPGRNVRVSPRLVRAGDEDRIAGYTGLPLRVNPYQARFFRSRARGRRLPAGPRRLRPRVRHPERLRRPGTVHVSFLGERHDPAHGQAAGTLGAGTRAVAARGARPRLGDRSALAARAGRRPLPPGRLPARDRPGRRRARGNIARGRHRLVFSVADYQETKNNENASGTLINTRRLTASFTVR